MMNFETTIRDIKDNKLWLSVFCVDCSRTTHIPYRLLNRNRKRLDDDLPVSLAAAFFRCSKCNGKKIETKMINVLDERMRRRAS